MRNREAAADLVQESYARVLGEAAVREPRALLYHTTRNLLIDQHRRAALRQHEELDALPEAAHPAAPRHLQPEEALESSQGWQACVAAIDALPPRCRDAFVLHVFEELPHAQIAARMGISVSMVEKHIARGMLSCQAQLRSLREAT
ncbi:sigma-70 family RNA polymerase sigma factor [Janthinobacterium sp. RB2P8]|uniref:sigma-70 family RNA polymerase sigma factor n=1 Tax=Janthinobacterium sp. RB2P8 TaxID=3424191 RepID=UPI003F202C0A